MDVVDQNVATGPALIHFLRLRSSDALGIDVMNQTVGATWKPTLRHVCNVGSKVGYIAELIHLSTIGSLPQSKWARGRHCELSEVELERCQRPFCEGGAQPFRGLVGAALSWLALRE